MRNRKEKHNAAWKLLNKLRVRRASKVDPQQSVYARLARFFRIKVAEEPKKSQCENY